MADRPEPVKCAKTCRASNLVLVAFDNVPSTYERDAYDARRVADLARGVGLAVIVPAQNEASSIGPVITAIRRSEYVDELVVVDDHSSDDTATVAAHHGARVVASAGAFGKGAAMAAGLAATSSELVVFLDADVLSPMADFVGRLIQPLLESEDVQIVKGYYERPLHHMPTGGGRVTELAARPILSLLFPGLGEIRQPLAGETAARRGALEAVDFESGYGVEIALLIDVTRKFGIRALAQVDLGVRRHRNRPLEELRPMASEVLRAALERYGIDPPAGEIS